MLTIIRKLIPVIRFVIIHLRTTNIIMIVTIIISTMMTIVMKMMGEHKDDLNSSNDKSIN